MMKAISIRQPWANRIASGIKTIETRTWRTRYRGPLLIVSTIRPAIEPAGCVVAIVNLVDCRLMTKADELEAWCNCYPGMYAFVLEDIRKLSEPFPVKGQQRIYEVDTSEIEEITDAR